MVVFIAIELEQEVREEIQRYARECIRPLCRGGRWVESGNYHLTLKYIGEAGEKDFGALDRLLREAAGNRESFTLYTGRVGVFGGSGDGRVRVLWLGTSGDIKALKSLRQRIEDSSVGMGYKSENRFSPHITLARDVLLIRQPDGIERPKTARIDVASVSLMESRIERGKRVYSPLAVYKFRRV